MAPGPSDLVRARSQLGNAAVAAVMADLPRGARPGTWHGQMMLVGQNLVGNQMIARAATASVVSPTRFSSAPSAGSPAAPALSSPSLSPAPSSTPAVEAPKKPRQPKPPTTPPGPKTPPPPAAKPEVKKGEQKERPDKGEAKKEAAGPRSPGADPKFQALKRDVNVKKKAVAASHPPAAAEAGAAQDAAEAPSDDQEARGKAAHAEDMDAAKPKEFNRQAFIDAVKKAIADKAPKNLDEADKFGESGKAEEVKTEVQGKVGEGKDASAKEIADTTAATPQPAPDAKRVVPMAADKVPGKPGAPNPAQAAPDQLPPSATDMSAGPNQVNQQMADAQVTERQLSFANAREPSFDKAVKEKKTMESHSEAAPKKLRAAEKGELNQVKATAATQGTTAMAGIQATRVMAGKQVGTGKQGAKKADEDKRTAVTKHLQDVFDKTKCDVEKILADLDTTVDDEFTRKEKGARDDFTREHEEGMARYKDERYGGWDGWLKWTRDLFAGLPDEANRIYERARDHYLAAMDQIIEDIATIVERELKRAKDRIATGRSDLKTAVDKLPADLREIGRQAATDFEGQFDELTDTVNDKGTELVDTLATKYTDAVKAVDDEIAAEKEKNKGLVAKAADAIGGAIKAIIELGRMLLGALAKAASAVPYILKDPIGFLGNLVTGVGGGLKLFMRNAGRHLEAGVLAWLLGTASTAGLQLPTSFDIMGILMMLAMVLGLTWANIRGRLARRVPNQALVAAETAVPMVAETKKRGVAGMWSDLRSRVGDLKKDLIKNLVSFLLPTIIIAGITWIVSLFNPASAFIRACKMIIDIIRFVVTNARQIIAFVNAVLDAVLAIAKGGTGGVPALVENALKRAIPVLIGALAALLGIGGIAGKVRGIFQKLARPVNRAVDWVIKKLTGLIKKLWQKLKPKKKRPKKDKPSDRRKDRGRDKDDRRDRDSKQDRQRKRLEEARRRVRSALEKGVVGLRLRALLTGIKVRYRLRDLRVEGQGATRAKIIGSINPAFQEFAEGVVAADLTRGDDSEELESVFRAMSIGSLVRMAVGKKIHISVTPKGEGRREPGVSKDVFYAIGAVENKKQKAQADINKYSHAVVVRIDFVAGAISDIMHGPQGAIDEGTATHLVTKGEGVIDGGVFVFHAKRPNLPKQLPIKSGPARDKLVYKLERQRKDRSRSENYLVMSKEPDNPQDVAFLLNAKIRKITVIGGIAGQVTEDVVRGLLGGGGGG